MSTKQNETKSLRLAHHAAKVQEWNQMHGSSVIVQIDSTTPTPAVACTNGPAFIGIDGAAEIHLRDWKRPMALARVLPLSQEVTE